MEADFIYVAQQAIDNGATTVEEVYMKVSRLPFDQLERIAALEGVVKKARGRHDQSVARNVGFGMTFGPGVVGGSSSQDAAEKTTARIRAARDRERVIDEYSL